MIDDAALVKRHHSTRVVEMAVFIEIAARHVPWHVTSVANAMRVTDPAQNSRSTIADADGTIVFRQACVMGLEGIVAKRRDRPYRLGRSPNWVKIKNPNAPAAMRIIEW
jgi:hypothetical protein